MVFGICASINLRSSRKVVMILGGTPPLRWIANCLAAVSAVVLYGDGSRTAAAKDTHKVMSVSTGQKLKGLTTSLSDMDHFMKSELTPFMRVRVPGTEGLIAVRDHIVHQLRNKVKAPWHVEVDTFEDETPYGRKDFHNVVATLDPSAPRRLTLACHYDSKYFPPRRDGRVFLGATDSAVPCAMLINMARILDEKLSKRKKMTDVTLQLMFFDGEEAFKDWTATDSIYGSRHLASKLLANPHVSDAEKTELDMMDALVLLDLIGAKNPSPAFYDHFDNTTHLFKQFVGIEKRLRKKDLLLNPRGATYFKESKPSARMRVEDDHIPFLHKGVPCLHLIALPFPEVWHTVDDDWHALDRATIDNLNRILRVFVVEYLHLG